jgi:hypothetical protein
MFLAHNVLENGGKFMENSIPYEFVHLAPSSIEMSADHLDLVIDPVSNIGSSN